MQQHEGEVGVYCILALEKQQVQTRVLKEQSTVEWNDTFILYEPAFTPTPYREPFLYVCITFDSESSDISLADAELYLTMWGQDPTSANRHGICYGRLYVPLQEISTGQVNREFRLTSENNSMRAPTIQLKLQHSDQKRNVGVDDFVLLKVVGKGNFGKVSLDIYSFYWQIHTVSSYSHQERSCKS